MKITVVGAGPAGLYFALLMKKQSPVHAITLLERDGPNDTFDWGIVFSERTVEVLKDSDPDTCAEITRPAETWDDVAVVHKGERITVGGNRFYGVARIALLNILHRRCLDHGVEIRFLTNVADLSELGPCDLLVGADGANSLVRRTYADFFLPMVDLRQNKYIWLGTEQPFDGLTMGFRLANAGLFITHSYRFGPTMSTFIVECPPETWLKAGFDRMSGEETCAYLAGVFKEELQGRPLLSNNFVKWLNFPLVKNKRWHHRNVVLLGDALHTAHFSIGSGSKRVGYNRLKQKDPAFIARYDRWRQEHPSTGAISEEFLDLFQKRTFAHLATQMADGTPHVTSVWVDYDGKHILINSAKGRLKDRNMEKRRYVALEVTDPDDPNRYLAVRGPVAEITEEGADEHLDKLARRYLGRDQYPPGWKFPGEVRRIYKIVPERVTPWAPFR